MTLEDKISGFCKKTNYWKTVEDVLFQEMECKIQKTVYVDNCVVLKMNKALIILEYYKKTPNEYHLWKLEMTTPSGTTIKFNILDGIQGIPSESKLLLTALTRALTPILIGE